MEKINVYLENDGKEVVIREGKALEARADKSISLNGVLRAPFQFLQGKMPVDPLTCNLQIKFDIGELEIGFREKIMAEELANFNDFECSKVVLS
jgi:hypothetical protein